MTRAQKTLTDLCTLIVDSEHKTAPTSEKGYPCIRTTNIDRGWFKLDGVRLVSEETYRKWTRRAVPRSGDLILAREAPVGNVAVIPPSLKVCLGQRTVLLRPDQEKVNPRYLCYLLLGDHVQHRFAALSSGATVPHLNLEDIRTFVLPIIHSRSEQETIASVISAYDELIENNTRRMAILEQMAQVIYREWFVNFRFPGHEHTEIVEAEWGPVPEGWPTRPMPELVEIDPSLQFDRSAERPYVPMANLSETSMIVFPEEIRAGSSGSKFQNGDTLVARITPSLENGKTGFVQFLPHPDAVALGSTEFIVLRSRTLIPELVYLLARSNAVRGPAIKSMTGASGRQRVQIQIFSGISIPQPPAHLIEAFGKVVRPIFEMIWTLARKNQVLRRARDLLLPKLISGEIDMAALDDELGSAA